MTLAYNLFLQFVKRGSRKRANICSEATTSDKKRPIGEPWSIFARLKIAKSSLFMATCCLKGRFERNDDDNCLLLVKQTLPFQSTSISVIIRWFVRVPKVNERKVAASPNNFSWVGQSVCPLHEKVATVESLDKEKATLSWKIALLLLGTTHTRMQKLSPWSFPS